MFKERYDFVKNITSSISEVLDLEDYYPHYFNVATALMNKIGGYNCALEGILSNIERFPFRSNIYRTPILGKKLLMHRFRSKEIYEVDFDMNMESEGSPDIKYDLIIFATMNNYLNPFFEFMTTVPKGDRMILLIIPAAGRAWINYKKALSVKNLDILFIEEMFCNDFGSELDVISGELAVRSQRKKDEISRLFRYRGYYFGNSFYPVIEGFIKNFVSRHILFTRYLDISLQSLSSGNTEFYVARDKRSSENSFIQIANRINGNTNMMIHGMITQDLERRLYTGHFHNVKNVFVWGEHGKDVVRYRQEQLGEECPNIIIQNSSSFAKVQENRKKRSSRRVIFASDATINNYINKVAETIDDSLTLIVRLHPGETGTHGRYKSNKPNVIFDDLNKPIVNLFSDAGAFVSYSSTTVLEAIYNGVPTLILNLSELTKKYPSFYQESKLSGEERAVIFVDSIKELSDKINKILRNDKYRNKVIDINNKLISYFVNTSSKVSDELPGN